MKNLILDECNIGDDGAERLGKILELNEKLKVLDISNNGITSKGCINFFTFINAEDPKDIKVVSRAMRLQSLFLH